jgi:AcrR family transcriptional regulator
MSPRSNSYNVIVDAAEDVAIESGASHMTLDAVAAKAGVSKGGLLHHFPSKIALLEAMIKHRIQIHQEAQNKIIEVMPKGPSRELKGYILAAVNRNRDHDRLCASLSAAMAHNPKLNEPVRKVVRETYTGFASSKMPFEKAAVIALAADGLWLQEMFNISPFTEEQREVIVDELLRLADEKAT